MLSEIQRSNLVPTISNTINNNEINYKDVVKDVGIDKYHVDFKYYTKSESSQPITTKSMQEMYQNLENKAKETYIRINKAENFANDYREASRDDTKSAKELRDMYNNHILDMSSPLTTLLSIENKEKID